MCSLQLACSLSVQCHKLSSTLFPAAAGNLLGLAAKERDTFLRRWWCGPQQTWAARRVHRHQLYQLYMVIVCRSFIHSLFCWPQKTIQKNKNKTKTHQWTVFVFVLKPPHQLPITRYKWLLSLNCGPHTMREEHVCDAKRLAFCFFLHHVMPAKLHLKVICG